MDPAARLANRALENESWARERLAVHAGRVFSLVCGPLVIPLRVTSEGLLESRALADGRPDLTLVVAPWSLPGLLAEPARWDELVRAEGDPALATTLRELAQTTPVWVEQFLGRWLGPVVGQRLADAGRAVLATPDAAARRLGDHVATYLAESSSLLATGEEGRKFAAQTQTLALRTDALLTRFEVLASRAGRH